MKQSILIDNNLIDVPHERSRAAATSIGTINANMLYYGYVLSVDAQKKLAKISDKSLVTWWSELESILKRKTGADLNMGDFVVYKNFPNEVLNKTDAEYWTAQIFMYLGFQNELFTQSKISRDRIFEKTNPKVLRLANERSLRDIFKELTAKASRWTKEELSAALFILENERINLDITQILFKENMAQLIAALIDKNYSLKISSATDVLRIAVAMSDGDVSMRTNDKFRNFKRSERRFLIALLEKTSNLEEDIARDKERWKRLFKTLHPFDYWKNFPRVCNIADLLFKNKVRSFNARLENVVANSEYSEVYDLLKSRPGEFMRAFHRFYNLKKHGTMQELPLILAKLNTLQLLKFKRYIQTINDRQWLTVAPQGNWAKLQILPNNKTKILQSHIHRLNLEIDKIIHSRLKQKIGPVFLCEKTKQIKLPTNDSDLLPFGRGTILSIPDNINFIRSASYWRHPETFRNIWFDNGWNFFDTNWENKGTVCWSATRIENAAVFSGDPTNSKTKDGRACQMIDLYLDKLANLQIRYGVWNILAYSRITFDASDVFASIQWGESPTKGELFEPSRAQFTVPVKGDILSKYILILDVKQRQIIYLDGNLKASVCSALANGQSLQKKMPAIMEYLTTLPSVYDLFENADRAKNGSAVVYDDKDISISGNAYVFRPANQNNKYTQLNLNDILK